MENSAATQSTTHPTNPPLLSAYRKTLVPPGRSAVGSATAAMTPTSFHRCCHLSIQNIELGRIFLACPFKFVSCAAPHRPRDALTDYLANPCHKSRLRPCCQRNNACASREVSHWYRNRCNNTRFLPSLLPYINSKHQTGAGLSCAPI